MPRSKTEVVEHESLKVFAVAGMLVIAQILLSIFFGFGGLVNAVGLYILATIGSNNLSFSFDQGLQYEAEQDEPSVHHWIRLGVNLAIMILGMTVWQIIGIFKGDEAVEIMSQEPSEVFKQLTGNIFLLKLLFALLSHVTLFAFWRFWVNIYNGMVAFYNNR